LHNFFELAQLFFKECFLAFKFVDFTLLLGYVDLRVLELLLQHVDLLSKFYFFVLKSHLVLVVVLLNLVFKLLIDGVQLALKVGVLVFKVLNLLIGLHEIVL